MISSLPLAFASLPGGVEWVVIGLIALLLFGRRLPDVARSLGQSISGFKAGLSGKYDENGMVKPDPAGEKPQSRP